MHAESSASLEPLVLGTANRKKAAELADLVAAWDLPIRSLVDSPTALDVTESGSSFEENARLKATRQAEHLGRWVLADDSGLAVDALGGAPGVFSARYAGAAASDEANRRKLLAELSGVEPARRTAHFVCCLALADPQGAAAGHVRRPLHGAHPPCRGGQRRIRLRPVVRDRRIPPHVRRAVDGRQKRVEPPCKGRLRH